jgi:hypothetical protein
MGRGGGMADWVDNYYASYAVLLDFPSEFFPGRVLMTKSLWEECLEYSHRFVRHVDKKPERPNG